MFLESDYPSAAQLRVKFSVKLEILPVPSGDDFRGSTSAHDPDFELFAEQIRNSLCNSTAQELKKNDARDRGTDG